LLKALPFRALDVRVTGANHSDPENPSDTLSALACGNPDPKRQALFLELTRLFFRDAFASPAERAEIAAQDKDLESRLAAMEREGLVALTWIEPD
jgi:hypothetical protein